jgi:hypothetical protein
MNGIYEGDVCNRNGCEGKIKTHPVENCSCHINPPCSACTTPRNYCPVCGWEELDDVTVEDWNRMDIDVETGMTHTHTFRRVLDRTKIDYVIKSHTHFSQICEGVYPLNATREDVLNKVKGTFGGRFEYFSEGKFKYIAYTD